MRNADLTKDSEKKKEEVYITPYSVAVWLRNPYHLWICFLPAFSYTPPSWQPAPSTDSPPLYIVVQFCSSDSKSHPSQNTVLYYYCLLLLLLLIMVVFIFPNGLNFGQFQIAVATLGELLTRLFIWQVDTLEQKRNTEEFYFLPKWKLDTLT